MVLCQSHNTNFTLGASTQFNLLSHQMQQPGWASIHINTSVADQDWWRLALGFLHGGQHLLAWHMAWFLSRSEFYSNQWCHSGIYPGNIVTHLLCTLRIHACYSIFMAGFPVLSYPQYISCTCPNSLAHMLLWLNYAHGIVLSSVCWLSIRWLPVHRLFLHFNYL